MQIRFIFTKILDFRFGLRAKMDPALRKWRIKMTEDNYRQMQMILIIFDEEKDNVLKHFIFLDVSEIHPDRIKRFLKRFLNDYEGHITGLKFPLEVDLAFLSTLKIETLDRIVFSYSILDRKFPGKDTAVNKKLTGKDTTCCQIPHDYINHETFVEKSEQIKDFIERHVESLREIEIQGNWILNISKTLYLNSLTLNSASCLNGIFEKCDGFTLSELKFLQCKKYVKAYPPKIDHLKNVTKLYTQIFDQSWVWLIHHFAPQLKTFEIGGSCRNFEKENLFHKMMNLETLVTSTYDQIYFDISGPPICLPSLTKIKIRYGEISENLFSLDVPKLSTLIITRDSTLPRNAVRLSDGFRQLKELYIEFQMWYSPNGTTSSVVHEFLVEANCATLERLLTKMCPYRYIARSDVEFRNLRTLESVYYSPNNVSGDLF